MRVYACFRFATKKQRLIRIPGLKQWLRIAETVEISSSQSLKMIKNSKPSFRSYFNLNLIEILFHSYERKLKKLVHSDNSCAQILVLFKTVLIRERIDNL